jgi:hypothetical protein
MRDVCFLEIGNIVKISCNALYWNWSFLYGKTVYSISIIFFKV